MSAMKDVQAELETYWRDWSRALPNGSIASIGQTETGYRLTVDRAEVWTGATLPEAVAAAGTIAARQIARAWTVPARVELFHDRDPDGECGISAYVNGEPARFAEYSIDPGRGYAFREYAQDLAKMRASASENVAAIIDREAREALRSGYVTNQPADPRVADRYFNLCILSTRGEVK